MSVPVTTVNENNLSEFREYEVGFARKVGIVLSKSVSAWTGHFPYEEFRFRIPTVDERHSLAAFSPRQRVH